MDQNPSTNLTLSARLEAVLFYRAEPLKIKELAKILALSEEEIRTGLHQLKTDLTNRGLGLLELNDEWALTTSSNASNLIESLVKEELNRDLGKASLETLAIILYQGPISRTRIDYIRGVNSGYILRHLLTRGLIEKSENLKGERSTVYAPTADLLAHLGLNSLEDLPDKDQILSKISGFEQELTENTQEGSPTQIN
jgi:segregation and condensation protein B